MYTAPATRAPVRPTAAAVTQGLGSLLLPLLPLGAPDTLRDNDIGADKPGICTCTFCRPCMPWRPCSDAKLKPCKWHTGCACEAGAAEVSGPINRSNKALSLLDTFVASFSLE